LHNATDLINAVKKAALDAIETSQPMDFTFGKVISTSPLKVSVEQKLTLGSAQLVLTNNVTDCSVEISSEDDTERRKITIHNGLKTGDEVILLKKKGGQQYLILDKVVNA
jgi:hypothetical protein